MTRAGFHHVYGPVPSRRLGRSLGIDLVPLKTCTYDCIYCQLGRTTNRTADRKEYAALEPILDELEGKLAAGPAPDVISLVGSGEPTLNTRIGELIGRIKRLTRVPVAVLTNGSLLWMDEVRDSLMGADLVLPSLDAGGERLFQTVNRPCPGIGFERMVDGIAEFTARFPGEVWLEVFLLAGLTGLPDEAGRIASLAGRIAPARTQLNTVFRPPAERSARALPLETLLELQGLFPGRVEIVCETPGAEPPGYVRAAVPDEEILALLGRHPCTAEDLAGGLGLHRMDALKRLEALAAAGKAESVMAGGRNFYGVHENRTAGEDRSA